MPTYTEKVTVKDPTDVVQLSVESSASQSQPLQTWKDAVPTNPALAQVSKDGFVQVGDDLLGFSTPDALIEAHRSDGSVNKPKRGFHALGRIGGTLTSVVQWVVEELELLGTSSINALHTALRVRLSNKNTGTPGSGAELRGIDVEVNNETTAGSAALTKATGLQVGVTNAAGKTISEAVGLRVKLNNSGTITNPYAIYTEGVGPLHLEDYLELKLPTILPTTNPSTNLVRAYPKSNGKLYYRTWAHSEEITSGMDLLWTYTVSGALPIIQTPSLPQNYKHLKIVLRVRCDISAYVGGLLIRPNGDANGNSYYNTWVSGVNTSTTPFVWSYDPGSNDGYYGLMIAYSAACSQAPANSFSAAEIILYNYSETGQVRFITYQSANYVGAASGARNVIVSSGGGVWTNTANAISLLHIMPAAGSFVSGTKAYIYGVA